MVHTYMISSIHITSITYWTSPIWTVSYVVGHPYLFSFITYYVMNVLQVHFLSANAGQDKEQCKKHLDKHTCSPKYYALVTDGLFLNKKQWSITRGPFHQASILMETCHSRNYLGTVNDEHSHCGWITGNWASVCGEEVIKLPGLKWQWCEDRLESSGGNRHCVVITRC